MNKFRKLFLAPVLASLLLSSSAFPAGIVDGQAVNAANSNAAWLAKNGNDTTVGIVTLAKSDSGVSGSTVANVQRYLNALASSVGVATNSVYNYTITWASDAIGTANQTVKARIESIVTAVGLKADLASPAFTGNPTAPTQSPGNNSTRLATTAYADALVSDVAYDATTWNSVAGVCPSKNSVRDEVEALITSIASKQSSDSTLTSLAAYNTNGILTQTAADTFVGRTLTGTSNTISVSNGDGVSGNPTVTIADNAVLPGTGSVTVPIGTTAQRSGSPVDGMLRYNSDSGGFEGRAAGAWGAIAGSGGGGINYITATDGSTIGTWAAYADAAGTEPVDATGGSPNSTYAVSTDSSLVGGSNFLWSKTGSANRQGEGFSIPFTIDDGLKTKMLSVTAYYTIASGTYVGDPTNGYDMAGYVYDVTNGTKIYPSSCNLENVVGVGYLKCAFQANYNSTSYRFAMHTQSTSTSNYAIRFDQWSISPSGGSSLASNVVFSASLSANQAVTANSTTIKYDTVYKDSTNSWNATTGVYTIPESGDYQLTGNAVSATAAAALYPKVNGTTAYPYIAAADTTNVRGGGLIIPNLKAGDTVSILSDTSITVAGSGGAAGARYTALSIAKIPNSSQNTDGGNVTALIANGTTPDATGGNPIIFPTIVKDTRGAYNASTGQYTAPETGFYAVTASFNCTFAVNNDMYLYIAGSNSQTISHEFVANAQMIGSTVAAYVVAGQTMDIRASANTSGCGGGKFNITKLPGSNQADPNATVKASYYASAATQTPGAAAQINFDTKIYDSHGAVTTGAGAWKFTAPISGTYRINAQISYASGSSTYIEVYKNGTAYQFLNIIGAGANAIWGAPAELRLLAGEYFDLRTQGSVTLEGTSGMPYEMKVDVMRTGNY